MTQPELTPAAIDVILAFADDEHLMGQQHTEWIGVAPFLEEDLAFASIGQDELGHAALLLEQIVGPDDADIDALAFFRPPHAWRSCTLVERPLSDWADTLVRHWLYDCAEQLRWQLFSGSSLPGLAALVVRAESEERFHRRHGDALLDVLLSVDDARDRIVAALDRLLPDAIAMFRGAPLETDAIAEGVVTDGFESCFDEWRHLVDQRFGEVTWPEHAPLVAGGDRSSRSEHFDALLARICEVLDLDRSAVW